MGKNKQKIKSNLTLRMTGLIVIGVLGFINTIGIYWGKGGLEKFGLLIFTILAILVSIFALTKMHE